jgi:hypothetical protein
MAINNLKNRIFRKVTMQSCQKRFWGHNNAISTISIGRFDNNGTIKESLNFGRVNAYEITPSKDK